MIDDFAMVISHGLLALAVWRLVRRADLDDESAEGDANKGFLARKAPR